MVVPLLFIGLFLNLNLGGPQLYEIVVTDPDKVNYDRVFWVHVCYHHSHSQYFSKASIQQWAQQELGAFFNWQLNATFVQRRQHHPLHQCLFSGLSPKKNDEQKPFFKECSEATFADTDSMVINVSTVISATYSCLTFLKACLYSVNWTATGAQWAFWSKGRGF